MKLLKPNFWNSVKIIFIPLYLLLLPFALAIQLINILRSIFTRPYKNKNIKIICVGNIFLGGTGKTPLSIELCKLLNNEGKNVVIIKKKYKNQEDEVELIKSNKCNIIVEKKRSQGIKIAAKQNYDVAILDDGYQDYSIYKDLNIICFGQQWIGNGLVIPAGPLRQSIRSLRNCEFVIINTLDGEINFKYEQIIKKVNKNVKIFYSFYEPNFEYLKKFKNEKLIAYAGIGNPNNFFDLLKKSGMNVVEKISFPDHYIYSKKDIDKIINIGKEKNCKLITTEKDFFRLKKISSDEINFLPIRLIIKEKEKFIDELKRVI